MNGSWNSWFVEALKDQGFARWNYTIRTIHHHVKSNLRSLSHTKHRSSPTAMASMLGNFNLPDDQRGVMSLSDQII
ncbi:hypothetical protein Hanom_Chr17g01542301 [Helianthus anomalus]